MRKRETVILTANTAHQYFSWPYLLNLELTEEKKIPWPGLYVSMCENKTGFNVAADVLHARRRGAPVWSSTVCCRAVEPGLRRRQSGCLCASLRRSLLLQLLFLQAALAFHGKCVRGAIPCDLWRSSALLAAHRGWGFLGSRVSGVQWGLECGVSVCHWWPRPPALPLWHCSSAPELHGALLRFAGFCCSSPSLSRCPLLWRRT